MSNVRVRLIVETDILVFDKHFNQGGVNKHLDRYLRQQKNEVEYLGAFFKDHPVGHILLKWGGSTDPTVKNSIGIVCPDIEDLFVLPEYRSQGIGSELILIAERHAKDRGYSHIGLSVSIDNKSAHRLYNRLGYKDQSFGEYVEYGEYIDILGQSQRWKEICIYLVKRL